MNPKNVRPSNRRGSVPVSNKPNTGSLYVLPMKTYQPMDIR
jgi:hypothetical protein